MINLTTGEPFKRFTKYWRWKNIEPNSVYVAHYGADFHMSCRNFQSTIGKAARRRGMLALTKVDGERILFTFVNRKGVIG